MANEQIFAEGVRVFDKHPAQPDFVVGTVVISLNDLVAFCKAKPELLTEYQGAKQLKLQLLRSKEGKLYSCVDTYKPGEAKPATPAAKAVPVKAAAPDPNDDLPF
jgi:hypothetical protein